MLIIIAFMSTFAALDQGRAGTHYEQGGELAPVNREWHIPPKERSMREVEDQHERQYLDERLRRHIQDFFNAQYSNKYNDVRVKVINGYVFLEGTVQNEADLLELEDTIRQMDDVEDVSNEVTVEVQLE